MINAITCKQSEIKYKGMKVYLEFSESMDNDNKIKSDVRNILSDALQEYLQKYYKK